MKSALTFFITFAISSSTNGDPANANCFLTCHSNETSCRFKCPRTSLGSCFTNCALISNKCYSKCPRVSSSVHEAKSTTSSSLRGLSTSLEYLEDKVRASGTSQDDELIKDDGQCGLVYNYCSSAADCCGDMDCVDFGANGYSITLCYDFASSFFGDDDNDISNLKFDEASTELKEEIDSPNQNVDVIEE